MNELIKTKKTPSVQAARVERVLEIATDNEIKNIEKNFHLFSDDWFNRTFIGLFGTVWEL